MPEAFQRKWFTIGKHKFDSVADSSVLSNDEQDGGGGGSQGEDEGEDVESDSPPSRGGSSDDSTPNPSSLTAEDKGKGPEEDSEEAGGSTPTYEADVKAPEELSEEELLDRLAAAQAEVDKERAKFKTSEFVLPHQQTHSVLELLFKLN
jgi:hypothetical protein